MTYSRYIEMFTNKMTLILYIEKLNILICGKYDFKIMSNIPLQTFFKGCFGLKVDNKID